MFKTLDTRRIGIFLVFAFGLAWAIALVIYLTGGLSNSPELFAGTGITLSFVLLAFGYMFAPAIAHVITRVVTKEGRQNLNLSLNINEAWRAWLAAWLLPVALSLLGAAVYFVFFPQHFDSSLALVTDLMRQLEETQGESLGISPSIFILILIGLGLFEAPLVNSFFTFGEEFGWRAYLQPKLMPLGFRKAMLLMGVIWGVWHWPVIAMGHNFGIDYPGAPWTGFLAMTVFTISTGTVLGWLTLKGGSVWPAVIAHASINGTAAAGILFLRLEALPNPTIGPAAVGLLGGIAWLLFAIYLLWKVREPALDVSRETNASA